MCDGGTRGALAPAPAALLQRWGLYTGRHLRVPIQSKISNRSKYEMGCSMYFRMVYFGLTFSQYMFNENEAAVYVNLREQKT